MRTHFVCCLAAAGVLASATARAQEPATIVMATYYQCTQGKAERADALYNERIAPLLKAEVAAGRIAGHGWGKHWQGGEWRRLDYMAGTDLDKMVDAREAVIKKLESAENRQAMEEFDTICPAHDDYVWASVTGSQTAADVGRLRTPFAMSTYFVCDAADEGEADAIVKSAFAPLLNQHVKEKKIASWNWLEHRMGGPYRRILVLDGPDSKSLLKYWGVLSPALDEAHPALSRRFNQVCASHSDYVWEMQAN